MITIFDDGDHVALILAGGCFLQEVDRVEIKNGGNGYTAAYPFKISIQSPQEVCILISSILGSISVVESSEVCHTFRGLSVVDECDGGWQCGGDSNGSKAVLAAKLSPTIQM